MISLSELALRAVNPDLYYIGLAVIYATGLVLLFAVAAKFIEHSRKPQNITKNVASSFSTYEMTIAVLIQFPFWVQNWGQIKMPTEMQYVYFGVGLCAIFTAILWHLKAKIDIKLMWSDNIEIKQNHSLITTGAYNLARHPMYASLLLWCWGASLITFNSITLIYVTFAFLPLIYKRAKAEEQQLIQILPEYELYRQNTHMLTLTLRGKIALLVKVIAAAGFGYFIWAGITLPALILLFSVHLYLGYALEPEKVAFSYRSKSGMMIAFWLLSLLWHPFYYLYWLAFAMFVYGLKFNCPCMIVYNKYHRCPCYALIGNLLKSKQCKIK